MRIRTTLCITLLALCHPILHAAGLTSRLPQADAAGQSSPQASSAASAAMPAAVQSMPEGDPIFGLTPEQPMENAPVATSQQQGDDDLPLAPLPTPQFAVLDADTGAATPIPAPPTGTPVHIEADHQSNAGKIYTLDGNVLVLYENYRIRADHVVFNSATGDVRAHGHLQLDGGPSDEHLIADHGIANVKRHTADLLSVQGTLGVRAIPTDPKKKKKRDKYVFTAPNPFALSGRELLQLGPHQYRILDGSMTSCRVPDPDWQLLAGSILVDNNVAHTRNTTFTLFHVPLFWLPYATHPVEDQQRQTGILIPIVGNDTTKGLIIGEAVYVVLGRSADATFGSEYFSKRGFAPFGAFRYRGRGHDFATMRFRSLLDRLPGTLNQGGVDMTLSARRDLDPQTRAVADGEYLSSYVYRQAFEENYSAAINSEVKSNTYITREDHGLAASGLVARYQNFRSDNSGDEIKVLHVPELHLDAIDQPLGKLPLSWGGEASASAMSRSEPGFQTGHFVPRVDLYPHLSLPLHAAGFHLRAEAGVRDTFYGDTQQPGLPGDVPVQQLSTTLNRTAFTSEIVFHPPALERDFSAPALGRWLRGAALRHTIEPEFSYHYVTGVNHYANTLRFDTVDALADTNEIGYGITQHLFVRHAKTHPCKGDAALGPDTGCGGQTVDWLTWTVEARHYFDPRFGHALVPHERNVFDTTLDLTGVAFLQYPRANSPVISRLHMQTTSTTDVEWDVDYDVTSGRMQSSNLFAAYRPGNYFFSFGDARLVNLLPTVTELPNAPTPNPNSTSSQAYFNQFHMAAGYGSPTKHGLSAGANIGYDLVLDQTQYLGVQTGYNRDCCGIAIEMRRYSLGTVRDDTQYLYSFTLANIGSVGSLRSTLRVF